MTEVPVTVIKLPTEDGGGEIILDISEAGRDHIKLTMRASNGTTIWDMKRVEAAVLGRKLIVGSEMDDEVRVHATNAPIRRPRPKANLQRNELTEESRRFPNVPYREE